MSNLNILNLPIPKVIRKVPAVHSMHPFVHLKNHSTLLHYCTSRLDLGAAHRDERVTRYITIDREVVAYLRLNSEDQKRADKRRATGEPIATAINLPLLHVHLTDMQTYFTGIFASPTGMYNVLSENPAQQDLGNALTTVMNSDSIHADHFKAVIRSTASALRYNYGGLLVEWQVEMGTKLSNVEGVRTAVDDIVWAGNALIGVDMYNTFWDPRVVDPTESHVKGEFCATIEPISFYEVLKGAETGAFFNTEAIADPSTKKTSARRVSGVGGRIYYRPPAREVDAQRTSDTGESGGGRGQDTDWGFFFNGTSTPTGTRGVELAKLYIWLNPIQMKLIKNDKENRNTRDKLELWRISIAEGNTIIETTHMNNIHKQLPLVIGNINETTLLEAQKSPAEYLQPLQMFGSFALNTHVAATRKNIWGLIAYNPNAIDLTELPEGEVVGRLPIKPEYRGKPMDEIIWQHTSNLETKQTVGDVQLTMTLLQDFYPTVAAPAQIAGIDRAIEDQVAAVVQGANRRLQMSAQMLDAGMFKNSRGQQYSNIIQYRQGKIKFLKLKDGVKTQAELDPLDLQELELDEVMGQGLKAINREAAVKKLNALVFALINSRVAAEYDMAAMITRISQFDGVEVDLTEFKLNPAATGESAVVTPEEGTDDGGSTTPPA